jgi:hypothetical protein
MRILRLALSSLFLTASVFLGTLAQVAPGTPVHAGQSDALRKFQAGQRYRIGALCSDGTHSSATGRGACSHHGGVNCWLYSDGTCTKP